MSYNSPALWAEVYEPFAETFGKDNVLIAGGCVRDYLHSKRMHPNDIDVFVRFDRNIDWEIATLDIDEFRLFDGGRMEGLREFTPIPNDEKYGTMEGKDWIGHGNGHYEIPEANRSVRINVIARRDVDARDPVTFVNKFDLNICRAWADPNEGFRPVGTDACLYDLHNNTITYGLDDGNAEKSRLRADRINQHLKGKYTLVGFPEKKEAKITGQYKYYKDIVEENIRDVDWPGGEAFAERAFRAGRAGAQWVDQPIRRPARPAPIVLNRIERGDANGAIREFWNDRLVVDDEIRVNQPVAPPPVLEPGVHLGADGVVRNVLGQRIRFDPVNIEWVPFD